MRFDSDFIIIGDMKCQWCQKSVMFAKQQNIDYIFVPVDQLTDKDADKIKSDTGKRYGSIPIIYHQSQYIGGYTEFKNMFII